MKNRQSLFNVDDALPYECGGVPVSLSETIVDRETVNDAELREKIEANEVPTMDTISRYS